jgi:hypothetical protein
MVSTYEVLFEIDRLRALSIRVTPDLLAANLGFPLPQIEDALDELGEAGLYEDG